MERKNFTTVRVFFLCKGAESITRQFSHFLRMSGSRFWRARQGQFDGAPVEVLSKLLWHWDGVSQTTTTNHRVLFLLWKFHSGCVSYSQVVMRYFSLKSLKLHVSFSITTIFNFCFGLFICIWGPSWFLCWSEFAYSWGKLWCKERHRISMLHWLYTKISKFFFYFEISIFYFLWHVHVFISEWELTSESLFLRNVFKGQILG